MFRYTRENIQKLLDSNPGYLGSTGYKGSHGWTEWFYTIADGKLFCDTERKEIFEGGTFENRTECDIDSTRRILKKFESKLDTSCVE